MPNLPARAFALALLAAAGVLPGCSSRPLPLTAQAGSSVAIALAGEAVMGNVVGYGSQVLAAVGRHDDQRGELRFVLRDAVSGSERALETRVVTRAWPDPASEIGLRNYARSSSDGFGLAQLLAIVDVPEDVPAGSYDLQVRRQRRTDGGGVEELPGPVYSQPLVVLPANVGGAVGAPTPSAGYAGAAGIDVTEQLADLVPLPKVVLALPAQRPHAAHVVIAYPASKVTPRAVIEEQHLGRGSIVAWTADPANGRITIDFVDPSASVAALALVFEPNAALSAGRIEVAEVTVMSATLYDQEGAVRSGTVTPTAIR